MILLDVNYTAKRTHRARLAALPIAEKLRLLDILRERTLALRSAAVHRESDATSGGGERERTGRQP